MWRQIIVFFLGKNSKMHIIKSKLMNTLKIIVQLFCFSFICLSCHKPPVSSSVVEGHEFITCTIDEISDTSDLKLSDISEYCEVVILENDEIEEKDNDVDRIVTSNNYIVVIPQFRPALLYHRNGKFIKQLVPEGKDERAYGGISAQIDDANDKIYVMVSGLKLLAFNVHDNQVAQIPLALDRTMDFTLLDSKRLLATFENDQNIWGYIQPFAAPQPEYLYSRYSNYQYSNRSRRGSILKSTLR